jgi:hypothetical protein
VNSSRDPISKKSITKKGLVEWLKVWALSSNPVLKKKNSGKMQKCSESDGKIYYERSTLSTTERGSSLERRRLTIIFTLAPVFFFLIHFWHQF